MSSLRIGLGMDTHAFAAAEDGRPLVLGGVIIPSERGLLGHSDADVLAHAIADALLGAARLGDIGQHFPDTDPKYAGADSMELLAQVKEKIAAAGYRILDIDSVVTAQAPRLAPHWEQIRARLSTALALEPEAIGLKATTPEHLGALGREEGIAATAVALLASRVGDDSEQLGGGSSRAAGLSSQPSDRLDQASGVLEQTSFLDGDQHV
jgi:2-C-methyl-D-erythritol 2,4-cyclodiphosphate synthase